MSAGFPGGNQLAMPGYSEEQFAQDGTTYQLGGMKPGQLLGGELTMTDPLTGLPRGAMPTAQTSPQGVPPPPTPGFEIGDTFGNPYGGMTPGQALGGGFTMPQPPQQPQQFPNLMQNPAFNAGIQPPQQMQQIAQGVPSLVNQLAPPPASGPVPGVSITQQPQPFPQAQPQPQPAPQPLMPPVAQAQPQQLARPPVMPQPQMPTRATQGYQSRVAPQPAPRPAKSPARRTGVSRAFARR